MKTSTYHTSCVRQLLHSFETEIFVYWASIILLILDSYNQAQGQKPKSRFLGTLRQKDYKFKASLGCRNKTNTRFL